MCGEPDEYAEVWNSRVRKARKAHKCCACGEKIRAGDRYWYTSGVFDGTGFDYKHCVRCWTVIDMLDTLTGEPADIHLDCGTTYEGDNEELIALAFMTPDEGQAFVAREKADG